VLVKGTRFSHSVQFREQEEHVAKPTQISEQELEEMRRKEIADLDGSLTSTNDELSSLQKEIDSFNSSLRQVEANLLTEEKKNSNSRRGIYNQEEDL